MTAALVVAGAFFLVDLGPGAAVSGMRIDMRQLQMFQKAEYDEGPIFKVVLEC